MSYLDSNTRSQSQGKVFLIGGGTGDPELITLKAVNTLKKCDVILIDELVNQEILNHASEHCRIVHVGKRGGCRSTPQTFINKLLVRYAKQGYIVGRLKGGDPFMFGRGGEEMQYLQSYNIPVEVISGISSGIAVPASINIPVTHREFTHGVTFLTGHDLDSYAWQSLVDAQFTIVIYMGMKNLAEITEKLLSHGMKSNMPVAIIQNGTTSRSKAITAPLSSIYQEAQIYGLASPSIIVIGQVVQLADLTKLLNHQQPIDYIENNINLTHIA